MKLYPKNFKNRFLTASASPQNSDLHSCLAHEQWSLAPDQNFEWPPCQISNFRNSLGIKEKKPFTLLEIMIVILLIGLIGSVIGYNMKGSLDEGRAFKSEQAAQQIKDILELEMAKDDKITPQNIQNDAKKYLRQSGLVKDPDKIIKDGWGNLFDISVDESKTITVSSVALDKYKEMKKNGDEGKAKKKK